MPHFILEKHEKRLPENPQYAEMRHDGVILTLQWHHGSTCGQRAAVRFSSFPRASKGLSDHTSKNNGNPDLVCEK